jgi:hypothetical protein
LSESVYRGYHCYSSFHSQKKAGGRGINHASLTGGRSVLKNKNIYKKFALALSLCLIVIWAILGTGASIAWFSDTSEELKNIFHFADFEVNVLYRNDGMTSYQEIETDTKIFNEEALYEPGYVQVVYLKVENNGSMPFNFKTAVSVTDYTPAINVYGVSFNLQDYLKFGVVTAETETALTEKLKTRDLAKSVAVNPLNNYSTEEIEISAQGEHYVAIVVYMPEGVSNEANYRGNDIPKVELGVIASAMQKQN